MYRSLGIISVFVFLTIIVFIVYANTFNASWHLDDRPNIVNNYYLHLDSLQPEKIVNTFYTNPHNPEKLGSKLYRPVACFTFAMNWYFGKDNVFGYHLVNTAIHALTAFFLFLFLLNVFKAPNLKTDYFENAFFIAFLASLLWAVNPIQTQAVTYIVQRMAQLAALFYLLGMLAYIKGRLSSTNQKRAIWFLCCLAFYLLGVFSKPNAAMLPLSLLLLEVAFFQDLSHERTRKKIFIAVLVVSGLILLVGSAVFLRGEPLSFLNGYQTRTFTFLERLLTQPRVVLFYLSQIFYPLPERLSIAHDIVLSSSLFKPWSTLPSILAVFILVGLALYQIQRWTIVSFAILFFFLNHIIESSIIPLELIFEHRNYLPSFFLFFPVAIFLNYLLMRYKHKNTALYTLIICFIVSLPVFFSASTYIRNQAWHNDITLWSDAVAKAPNNARASNILAIKLAWGENSNHPNRYEMALKLFEDSLEKHIPSTYVKADIYGNMALIYFHRKNQPQKAFECFKNALEIHPGNLKIRRDFVNALIIQKRFGEALRQVDRLLLKNSENGIYHNLKGNILLWQGKYDAALTCFKNAYELLSKKASVILNTSVALSLSGRHENADQLLLEAIEYYPEDITFYFAIIENSIRAGEEAKTFVYLEKLNKHFDKEQIQHGIETYTHNPRYAPISRNRIETAIKSFEARRR